MTATDEATLKRAPLAEGDIALVYDQRKRRYRIELKAGALLETHLGYVTHDEIIGRHEGFFLNTNKGRRLFILRPAFSDAVRELPRQSQVIYPKDLAALLMHADIYPGARVIEVGLGSGAASAALLRAVGPQGSVVTHEVREEIIAPARRNVEHLAPGATNHRIVVGDAYASGIGTDEVDRVVLDVPEPWRLIPGSRCAPAGRGLYRLPAHRSAGTRIDDEPHAGQALVHGGIVRIARTNLALLGDERSTGSSHGGAHRLHHDRPAL